MTVASRLTLAAGAKPPRRGSRNPHDPHPLACPSYDGPVCVIDPAAKSVPDHRGCKLIRGMGLIGMLREIPLGILVDLRIWSLGIGATCQAESDRLRCRILTAAVGRSARSRCESGEPLPR